MRSKKYVLFLLLGAWAKLCAGPSSDLIQLTEDHTQFAFSLYPSIDVPEESFVFSPFSISSCLSMVYLGARGNTESQMQKALHLDVSRKNIAKTTFSLCEALSPKKNDDRSYRLNIANAVWINQDTFLLADFRYAIEQQFNAKLGKVNFLVPAGAISVINDWTSEKTQGKIPQLLTADDVNEQTRLVMTNAVFFQGIWKNAFDLKATGDWPFHPTPDSSMTVKMMHQTLRSPYYENDLMQMAALPFNGISNGGGNLAFVLLLPKSAENFDATFGELAQKFNSWLSSLSPELVELKLPKFALNTRVDLGEPLQKLGMEDAFDSNANFMGIDGMRDLFLNKVVHQAFFDLDENGVTAAAATAASIGVTGMLDNKPPIQMIADHPFLFFIVDLKSQEMLFMGKIVIPKLSQNLGI